ncbi:MAG TPA: response regulator [Thermoanaerobaculia bacterium]|jgi:DNA-binding response OmpR family regulator|nr:response regulator [Thermoanaerobaculia bacterium]
MSGVLVIEDDRALCRLFELMLKRDGLTAEVVQRGDDGADAIERNGDGYDAILLDMMLPGMNGAEILSRVRSTKPHLLDRILVISAAPTQVLQAVEKDGHVRGVFRKPFDLDSVVTTLRECVRESAASRGH